MKKFGNKKSFGFKKDFKKDFKKEFNKNTPPPKFKSYNNKLVTKQAVRTPGPSPIPKKDPNSFPMRINKYLAFKGYATRRAADEIIIKRRVTINGQIASLGDKVGATDVVEVQHGKPKEFVYYAYNKPRGVSTTKTRSGSPHIGKVVTINDVFPVCPLDTNAQGLVILTNDKRIIDRLQNDTHAHEKEYFIRSLTPLRGNFKEKMQTGISIGNGQTVSAGITIIDEHSFRLVNTDNGSHIRQMCADYFAEIEFMNRMRIMNIRLGSLQSNAFRKIEDDELKEFLSELGL